MGQGFPEHCVARPELHLGRLCSSFFSSDGGLAGPYAYLCLVSMKLMISPITPAESGIWPWGSMQRGPVLSFNTELYCDPQVLQRAISINPPQDPPGNSRTRHWKRQGICSQVCNAAPQRPVLVPGQRQNGGTEQDTQE